MINVLTVTVMVWLGIVVLTWFLHDVLPQILFERKLAKTRQLAEESRRQYIEAREHDRPNAVTIQFRIPKMTEERSTASGRHRRMSV